MLTHRGHNSMTFCKAALFIVKSASQRNLTWQEFQIKSQHWRSEPLFTITFTSRRSSTSFNYLDQNGLPVDQPSKPSSDQLRPSVVTFSWSSRQILLSSLILFCFLLLVPSPVLLSSPLDVFGSVCFGRARNGYMKVFFHLHFSSLSSVIAGIGRGGVELCPVWYLASLLLFSQVYPSGPLLMRATVSTVTDAKDKARQLCWSHQRLAAVSILWFLPTRTHPRTRHRIQVWSSFFSFCSWSLEVFTMNNTCTSSQHHTYSMDETWLLKEGFIWKFCHYLLTLMLFWTQMTFFHRTQNGIFRGIFTLPFSIR